MPNTAYVLPGDSCNILTFPIAINWKEITARKHFILAVSVVFSLLLLFLNT